MFQRPANVDAALNLVLDELPVAWRDLPRQVVSGGSAHETVLVGQKAAVRIARDAGVAARMARRQRVVDSLPDFSFRTPRSLSSVVNADGTSAVAVEYIPGEAITSGTGDPNQLMDLLRELWNADLAPIAPFVAEPLEYCGGDTWRHVMEERVLPLFGSSYRGKVANSIGALGDVISRGYSSPVLSHGDLAGHNMMWQDGVLVGVIDWDLASLSDRSTYVASLAAWHGFDIVERAVEDPQVIRDARVRFASFPLQNVAFAVLNGRSAQEIEQTVARAEERLARR